MHFFSLCAISNKGILLLTLQCATGQPARAAAADSQRWAGWAAAAKTRGNVWWRGWSPRHNPLTTTTARMHHRPATTSGLALRQRIPTVIG